MGSIFFFLLLNGVRSNFYFYMIFYFYFIAVLGFCSLFLLVATRFCSVFTRLKLYYIRCFCAVFLIKSTIKKTKRNNTEQKNLYGKNIIVEGLNKKDKGQIEKRICSLFFPLFSYTLFNCVKKWTFI